MIIKCGGNYAASYTAAEVNQMLADMERFQVGRALQRAVKRPRATGLGVDIIRVPAARAFSLKEPQADADGIV